MEVELFIPCFVDQVYPEAAFNTIKVLEKAGCTVFYNAEQSCCGQPAYNAGHWEEAWQVGKKFIADCKAGDPGRPVVAPSASCAGFVRNGYPELFENSSVHNDYKSLTGRIWELSEFLVDVLKVEDLGSEFKGKATYHSSCASLRECVVGDAPKKLLSNVKGLELVDLSENTVCCGFGGTFSVKFESISTGMADEKCKNVVATGADYLISTDLSCLMHLDGYMRKHNMDVKVMHLADVLASGL